MKRWWRPLPPTWGGDSPERCEPARWIWPDYRAPRGGTSRASGRTMSRKLLLTALLVSVGGVALVLGTGSPAPVYAITVSEFLDSPRLDTTLRISGPLVKGSLCRVTEPCGYYFRVAERYATSDPARELEVSYPECVVPDTFREVPGLDVEVTVEGGRCATCHTFEATRVMAKCPGKYEMSRYRGVMPGAPIPICEGSRSRKDP